jgi:large subunit ribosomal protein L24
MGAKLHVKKGDTVLVLSGNDKGKEGVIKQAFPRDQKVLIEGINLRWHHRKPKAQNQKGERIQQEAPIHASKVRRVENAGGKKAKKKGSK